MPMPAKRTTERHGHRTKAEQNAVDTSAVGTPVGEWPEPDPSWPPMVVDWYRELERSGQAVYFEPSDVAAARFVAYAMAKTVTGKFSATSFGEVWSAMGDLGTTEGARRRMKIELQKPDTGDEAPSAGVTHLDSMRARMEGPA